MIFVDNNWQIICKDITKWLNKSDLYLLETNKGNAKCIFSKKKIHEMVEPEVNKVD